MVNKLSDTETDLTNRITRILPILDADALTVVYSVCCRFVDMDGLPSDDDETVASAIANHLISCYPLGKEILPAEYNYSCLPLCLLDAVFSIGARYSSTRNVVMRYCAKQGIREYRKSNGAEIDHTIKNLLAVINHYGPEGFATDVLENTQRTSSTNGVLKAEAVQECASILDKNDIQTIDDFREKLTDSIAIQFRNVKGQTSGISLRYLKMLCGTTNEIKPDRHVLRFLSKYLGYEPTPEKATRLLGKVSKILDEQNLTRRVSLREIDYLIWSEMARQ